jgi:hypothetical protein
MYRKTTSTMTRNMSELPRPIFCKGKRKVLGLLQREEKGLGVDGESPPFSLWNGQHRKVSMPIPDKTQWVKTDL